MFLPIATDAHDGRIGYAAIFIVAICLVVHIFVSNNSKRIEEELYQISDQIEEEYFNSEVNDDESFEPKSFIDTFDSLYSNTDLTEMEIRKKMMSGDLFPFQEKIKEKELEIKKKSLFWKMGLVANDFNPLSLLTHMFVHADWIHLIGNMFFFYICGVAMERYWGLWKFVASYLFCGLGAAGAFILVSLMAGANIENAPLIGASGAIAGAMGAFTFTHYRNKVTLLWFFGFRAGTFNVQVPWYFGFWIAGQVFYALMTLHSGSGIAYTAHIGGFVIGAILAFILKSEDQLSVVAPQREAVIDGINLPDNNNTGNNVRNYDQIHTGMQNATSIGQAMQTYDKADINLADPKVEQIKDAWHKISVNDPTTSANIILDSLNVFFNFTDKYYETLAENLSKLIEHGEMLPIDHRVLYQWSNNTLKLGLEKYAIGMFELTSKKTDDKRIQLNSIFYAAQLRIKLFEDMQRAINMLNYIVKNDTQGVLANQAKMELEKAGYYNKS